MSFKKKKIVLNFIINSLIILCEKSKGKGGLFLSVSLHIPPLYSQRMLEIIHLMSLANVLKSIL
jgi:hypothetical protein